MTANIQKQLGIVMTAEEDNEADFSLNTFKQGNKAWSYCKEKRHQLGELCHAGAIVGGSDDTSVVKRIMAECGIHVVDSPAAIGKK